MTALPKGAFLGIVSILLAAACWPALAQSDRGKGSDFFPGRPPATLTFRSVLNDAPEPASGEALVQHPVKSFQSVALKTQWPASFFVALEGQGPSPIYCSATLVGPRTLITAGHCLPGKTAAGSLVNKDSPFGLQCTRHPDFKRDRAGVCRNDASCPPAADVALCLLDQEPVVERLEAIQADTGALKYGMRVLLSGFGCVRQADGADASTASRQVLTVGWAAIDAVATAGNPYFRTRADLDLSSGGLPAEGSELCKGDSGGGTYLAAMDQKSWAKRRLVGINSGYAREGSPSYIVSLASPSVRTFLRSWASLNQAEICGAPDSPAPSPACAKALDAQ